ncbi:MAG TPA: hypothetical protein VL689_18600 [Paraburkholderia sp.]|jgi:hypothetical protein|nr:hypothetical protein [Paraburkholderia sp.]
MTHTTDYLAPFSLWLCVRRHYCADGTLFVEPAWTGHGAHTGPVIFASRLHAHIYTALRNRHHLRGDSNNWQCVPLQAFGLREHIRELGGRVNCEMAFGFVADEAGALVLAEGAPQMRYVELSFDVDEEVGDSTFSFNQWAFEYMYIEWIGIGASSLHGTFDRVDAMGDAAFARLLDTALAKTSVTRDASDAAHWAVFDPNLYRWVGAPVCPPLHALTLH